MSTKRLSRSVIIGSIFFGSGMAWSDLLPLATPAAESRIDFNQVFADFVPRDEFNASFHNQLRNIGWNLIVTQAAENVNRARKGDRLPKRKGVVLELIRLPGCEPLASRLVDPILGQFVGRCDA